MDLFRKGRLHDTLEMPRAGIEPARTRGPGDFKSPASANSATSAHIQEHSVRLYYHVHTKLHCSLRRFRSTVKADVVQDIARLISTVVF